jgi:pantothenate kinase
MEFKSSNTSALVSRTLDLFERSQKSQFYIGIAGAPGSGKSTFAQRLAHLINKAKNDPTFAVLIPMDGYHYTQAQLRIMSESGQRIRDPDASTTSGEVATFDDLMKRRGAPWTFDSEALYQNLASTKQKGYGSFPHYDRSISDPVADQILVKSFHKIIICEGNYLLAYDDPAWLPLKSIWDDTWFIDVPEKILTERLIRRHLQNWTPVKEARFGVGRKGALAKVDSSDIKHAQFVHRASRHHANVIIYNT